MTQVTPPPGLVAHVADSSSRIWAVGSVMNRLLSIKTGQCHVQRYVRPLLNRIQRNEIDPSFVITHRLQLDEAPTGYEMFLDKEDDCMKVVLKP